MARPTALIKDVLSGRTMLKDSSRAIQSACEFHFYKAARAVMSQPAGNRKEMINTIPANLHDRIRHYARMIGK